MLYLCPKYRAQTICNECSMKIQRNMSGPSWPEAMSYRSPRSITGRDQKGFLLDLGIIPIFVEIFDNVLNKGSGEDSLDFLGLLTLPPTTSRFEFPILSLSSIPSVFNAVPR